MIRVVITILLITSIVCQPKCSASGIPHELPALTSQHILLDLNRNIQGPNITLQLHTQSSLITLLPKYISKQQTHNIGKILQISTSSTTNIITMLGVSSNGLFYIYYANITNPNILSVKQIPTSLNRCTNHAISPNGLSVSITCQNQDRTKYAIAYTTINTTQPWTVLYSKKYSGSIARQIQYINNIYIAIIISHPYNSYIQLWDSKYGRLVNIFDRTFFALVYMNIVDIQMTGGILYILDYQTGVYKLRLQFNTFIIQQQLQFTYYTKMAVFINSLVICKKGSITQFSGKNVFKYQTVGNQTINQLIISDQYILVFTKSQTIAYLRGIHTSYFTIPYNNQFVCGIFISNTKVIQTVSISQRQIKLQQLSLHHPILNIPQNVLNTTSITIQAISRIQGFQQHCKISFVLIRTQEQQMEIFDSQYDRNGTQHIYMNRPGRAEIQLSAYGMGPNLHYQVKLFAETVNLTAQIRKTRNVESIYIQGIDKMRIKGTYFSDTCGIYKNQCPLAIDVTNLNMMKYYLCSIIPDYYGIVHKINCTQRYLQFKQHQYLHYQLQQSITNLQYFYQISIAATSQDQIQIRKFEIGQKFFRPFITSKYKINGTNKYGQNNITQLQFDQQSKLLYILLPIRKQILILQIQQNNNQQIRFVQRYVINSQLFDGKYFAPKSFRLDSDGCLWIKNIDLIWILDFREIRYMGKPKIVSEIVVDLDKVKDYQYQFQIVQNSIDSQLFKPTPTSIDKQSLDSLKQSLKTLDMQQRTRRYLIIYGNQDTLLMSTINHLYQVQQNSLQPLPRYGYHIPKDRSQLIVQSLGNSQLFITLIGYGLAKYGMIYNLDSLSMVSVYYTSIQTKVTSIPAYFHVTNSNPVIIFLDPQQNSTIPSAFQISQVPKMLLTLSQMMGQTQSQLMLIQVFNQKVHIRHSIVLGISNSPQNLTKGQNYPYPNSKAFAIDRYIQINTQGWVDGNVLNISYVCDNCKKPNNQQQPYIDIKGKLWIQQQYNVAGGQQLQIIIGGQNPFIAIIRNNMLYTLDHITHSITGLHQITQSPNDIILSLKYNALKHILLAGIISQNGQINIVTYGTTNFKGFQLSSMLLPSSVLYIMNVQFKGDVAVVLDLNNIYIISVDNYGACYLVDYINQIQAGGSVCWVQLIQPNINNGIQHYTIIITLCQSGITYITFKLQNLSILTILSKQTLDLKSYLNSINIRMPTDSTFRRSLSTISLDNTYINLFMIIRNFNSYQWKLLLRNKAVIYQVKIDKVIHRYADFGATQFVSIGGSQGRFIVMSYYGYYDNYYQYIHAIYDRQDIHDSTIDQPYKHCYIMQSFTSKINTKPQYYKNRTLLLLSDDAYHIKSINTDNKFRAIIHNQKQLLTQSVFMIPYTPVSSIKIQILVKGIDIVVWEVWEILLLVFAGLVIVGIGIFFGRMLFGKYQRKKKLVPLLVDYAEYEEDMAQEIQEKKRQTLDYQENVQGNINKSDRGSIPH